MKTVKNKPQPKTNCELHPAIRDRIQAIAAEIFQTDADSIELAMGPEQIDRWDSLNHLRLITAVESEFSLKLSMQQIQQIACLDDIATFVSAGSD